MNIRKHNADEHTVMGYASYCACSLAVTICSCSTTLCFCACQKPNDDIDSKQAATNFDFDYLNSALKAQSSNSAESTAIH